MTSNAVLFISSELKGNETIEAVKAQGCTVYLMTEERHRDKAWAWSAIDEAFFTPELKHYQNVINTVTWLLRTRNIGRIIPLDEFEQELAAILREHLQVAGKSISDTKPLRDKLIMRNTAKRAAIPMPRYMGVLNHAELDAFMREVPPLWLLKPRTEASAMGIRKAQNSDEVWSHLGELGDSQSYYLLEQFIPGDIFHVDSIVWDGQILFSTVQRYGAPPLQVYQGGGIFNSRMLQPTHPDAIALSTLNAQVIAAMPHRHGVTHAEFIKAHDGSGYYFLEIAGRVGGAFIGDMIEQATGINLWREWGKIEVALLRGEPYQLPPVRSGEYGGLIVTLAKQEHPDFSAYTDPELVWRANKPYHAAFVLKSADPQRLEELLASYNERFAQDFLAVAKPLDAQRTGASRD